MCCFVCLFLSLSGVFFFQAEDGIRDLVRSRGLGDVYKRQEVDRADWLVLRLRCALRDTRLVLMVWAKAILLTAVSYTHLTLPTSDLV